MKMPHAIWLSKSEKNVRIELEISPTLDVFDGHFPNEPIVPGVAQIDWMIRLARESFDMPQMAATDFQVKFRKMIRPQMTIHLALDLNGNGNRLNFTYFHQNEIMSSGLVKLGAIT